MLVGRSREIDALAAAFAGARDGAGGVVFLVGEAGIGKSRLVHEVTALAAARNALVLRGRAVPGATAAPFRPLAEALGAVATPVGDELARESRPARLAPRSRTRAPIAPARS